MLERLRRENPPISDVAQATRWWGCYSEPRSRPRKERAEALRDYVPPAGNGFPDGGVHQVRALRPSVGRNDPCPCGSGKKYKKCCIDKDVD